MAKKKSGVKAKSKPVKEADNRKYCPCCLEVKGVKIELTAMGTDAVSCPKCNAWFKKAEMMKETPEQKKARLKAEMAAKQAELDELEKE